jgi:Family of unknown function (DUF6518)
MRTALVLALLAAAGVAAGVVAKAADESGHAWAGDLGSYPAAWVLVVAVIGWAAPSARHAAVRAAVFFAAMTAAYYAWSAEVLHFGWQPHLLLVWLLASVTAVPAVAAAAEWASRRAGVLPGALLALPAGIALGGGVLWREWLLWTAPQPFLPAQPVQAVADAVTALVLVLALPRSARTRVWAVLLLVPMWWLAAELLGVAQPYTV